MWLLCSAAWNCRLFPKSEVARAQSKPPWCGPSSWCALLWMGQGRALTLTRAVGGHHVTLGMDTWVLQNWIRQQRCSQVGSGLVEAEKEASKQAQN